MEKIDPRIREILNQFRLELDEHVEDINRNTGELSDVHEYAGELDMKLEKLAERIDALQALVLAQTRNVTEPKKSIRLSPKERDVLKALVGSEEPLSSGEVGKQAGLTADVVAQTLYCMKQKGVPVLAQTMEEQTFYDLDSGFKRDQLENQISFK